MRTRVSYTFTAAATATYVVNNNNSVHGEHISFFSGGVFFYVYTGHVTKMEPQMNSSNVLRSGAGLPHKFKMQLFGVILAFACLVLKKAPPLVK